MRTGRDTDRLCAIRMKTKTEHVSEEDTANIEDTRERILQVAAELFTQHGFAATSMRMIAKAAAVPLSSINYHFGAKQALMEAVYTRMLDIAGAGSGDYLDRLATHYPNGVIPLEKIVEAYIGSALRLSRKNTMSGFIFRQLMARAFFEPGDPAETILPAAFARDTERYKQSLMRVLPHLSEQEVVWRLYYWVGLVAYVLGGKDIMGMKTMYQLDDADDPEKILARMVPFIVAGFRAPAWSGPAQV